MVQFVKTLAQLSAGILSASLAVPVYSYYVHGRLDLFNKYDSVRPDEIHKSSSLDDINDNESDDENPSDEAQHSSNEDNDDVQSQ